MGSYGFLSVLPPLIAIVLAAVTRNVLVSLFIGVFSGVFILSDYNLWISAISMVKNHLFVQAADSYNSSVFVLVIFIGGMVSLLTKSGGAAALAKKGTKLINSKTKVTFAVWITGLLIWFSDYANALLIGPIFQPIADKLKMSREKLAWIIDATSSPVCSLVPIGGFGIYAMGCLQKEFHAYGMNVSEWKAFIMAAPLQFYSIGALLLVPLVALLKIDFGSMYKAEKRTVTTGQPMWPKAKPLRLPAEAEVSNGVEPKLILIVLPVITIFVLMFSVLIANGFPNEKIAGVDLRTGLTLGYFGGGVVCLILMVAFKIKKLSDTFDIYIDGMKSNVFLCAVLLLAWTLGAVCKEMGTANYVVKLVEQNLPIWMAIPLMFITGACISFATGTSYGTYAVLIPVAVPMSYKLGLPLLPCIGAVLSGGIFGDQCSPISDTTVLSSMGAACDLVDHVKTQLPYAFIVALVSIVVYIISNWISSVLILFSLFLVLLVIAFCIVAKLLGKKHFALQ